MLVVACISIAPVSVRLEDNQRTKVALSGAELQCSKHDVISDRTGQAALCSPEKLVSQQARPASEY